jgi:hypothetical protein
MKYFKSPIFWLAALLPFAFNIVYALIGPILWSFWQNVPDYSGFRVLYVVLCVGALIFLMLKKRSRDVISLLMGIGAGIPLWFLSFFLSLLIVCAVHGYCV